MKKEVNKTNVNKGESKSNFNAQKNKPEMQY